LSFMRTAPLRSRSRNAMGSGPSGKEGQAASLLGRVSSPPGSRCGISGIDAEASRPLTDRQSPLNARRSPRLCAACVPVSAQRTDWKLETQGSGIWFGTTRSTSSKSFKIICLKNGSCGILLKLRDLAVTQSSTLGSKSPAVTYDQAYLKADPLGLHPGGRRSGPPEQSRLLNIGQRHGPHRSIPGRSPNCVRRMRHRHSTEEEVEIPVR
jgi:hypothetical protein